MGRGLFVFYVNWRNVFYFIFVGVGGGDGCGWVEMVFSMGIWRVGVG